MLKFSIKLFFIILIIVSIFLFLGYLYLKWDTHPLTEGKLVFSTLSGQVYIYRDKNGIPHIYATDNDDDIFFALGFVHAQDRFWQMEFQRRVASGTLSEIFGEKTLSMDIYLRTYGFYFAAKLAWSNLDQRTKRIIEYYTAGVNAFIQQKNYPLEIKILRYHPKPWTNIDSIAWQKMMAWNLQKHSWLNKLDYMVINNEFPHKILTYFPPYPDNAPVTVSGLIVNKSKYHSLNSSTQLIFSKIEKINTHDNNVLTNEIPGKGSNAWVISPKLSKNKNAILANDVHLDFSAPSLWYLVELRGPHLHVTGASIPGLPAIAIGHNDDIAWGVTNGYNDAAEIYILNKNNKITSHVEKINIRHENPYILTIQRSEYGPIINSVTPPLKLSTSLFSLTWPALMPGDTTVQSFIKINYAHNWDEFTNALKDFVSPTQNFLYADTKGNIGYYYPGLLPIRKTAILTPVPATKFFRWQEYIPFSQLPHVYNPSIGYIVSANNKITNNSNNYLFNARWPIPPFRIERIIELLNQKKTLNMFNMIKIQNDVKSQFWVKLKPYLLKIHPDDKECEEALLLLRNWSGEMDTKSKAATIYAYWLNEFSELIPINIRSTNKTIEPLYLLNQLQNNLSENDQSKIFHRAVQKLILEHSNHSNKWMWGNMHKAIFMGDGLGKSALMGWIWNRQFPSSGDQYTVNVGRYNPENFNHIQGATFRQIINLGNLDNSLYIIPMGQSGNPFSKHYDDFNKKWSGMSYVTIPSLVHCQLGHRNCLVLTKK